MDGVFSPNTAENPTREVKDMLKSARNLYLDWMQENCEEIHRRTGVYPKPDARVAHGPGVERVRSRENSEVWSTEESAAEDDDVGYQGKR